MDCVDRFAPEKQVAVFKTQGNWIKNEKCNGQKE